MPAFGGIELLKVSADPAAGNEVSYTADEDMVIHAIHGVFVTSAVVANRRVSIVADDGVNIFFRVVANADLAASLTTNISAFEGAPAALNVTTLTLPLPTQGLRLRRNDRVRTITTGIDVGDDYSVVRFTIERAVP